MALSKLLRIRSECGRGKPMVRIGHWLSDRAAVGEFLSENTVWKYRI